MWAIAIRQYILILFSFSLGKKHKTSPKLISEVFMVEVLLGLTDNIFLLFVYIASLKTYGQHKCSNLFRYDNKSMQNNCIPYLESF